MADRRGSGRFIGFGEGGGPPTTEKKKEVPKVDKEKDKKQKVEKKKEVKKTAKEVPTYTWQMENFSIMLADGDEIMVALMLDSEPSDSITQSLVNFTKDFEKQFKNALRDFRGNIRDFQDAKILCEEEFNLFLMKPQVLPLEEEDINSAKLNVVERSLVKTARDLAKERGFFFIAPLIDETIKRSGHTREKVIQSIFAMKNKKVLISLDIDQISEESEKRTLWTRLSEYKTLTKADKETLLTDLLISPPESRETALLALAASPRKKLSGYVRKIVQERSSVRTQREQLFTQLDLLLKSENLEQAARVLVQIADYSERLGERTTAAQFRTRANDFNQRLEGVRQRIPVLRGQLNELLSKGELLEIAGKYTEALDILTQASKIATEVGDFEELKRCQNGVSRIRNLIELASLRESLR